MWYALNIELDAGFQIVDATHERGRRGQIAGDGREVERRDRVDEALERPVLRLVPDAGAVDRLFRVDLGGVRDVEAPEINELARRVDLGLERGLRLPEHRGGVDCRAPFGREQLSRLEEHRSPVLPGPRRPFTLSASGRLNRLPDVPRVRHVVLGQHMAMAERHHRLLRAARPDLAPADDDGDLEVLLGHRRQPSLQRIALRRTGRVAL